MKKSGKNKSSKNSKPVPKTKKTQKQKPSKTMELEEENPEFSSENEYMNYIGLKSKIYNDIQENFDDPLYYLMGNSDNIISRSTYTKIEYENGKPINEEKYQAESVNHKDKKGHNIVEKKEKYKNEKEGIEKISHQKLLDGKGTKVIRKVNLNSGDKEEHNIYQGIKEQNIKDFNKKYNNIKEKVKLDEMFEKVKLLGKKRNLDQGKVLLLGDGHENKKEEEKKEKKEKKEGKNKKEKKDLNEKKQGKKQKDEKKQKEEVKEKERTRGRTDKKREAKMKDISKSKSKNKNKKIKK